MSQSHIHGAQSTQLTKLSDHSSVQDHFFSGQDHFFVAEIILKRMYITSSVTKITSVVGETTFKVVVITFQCPRSPL